VTERDEPVRATGPLIAVEDVARRWGVQRQTVRHVIRDGWLQEPEPFWVPMRDVAELEAMRMPAKWRRWEASGATWPKDTCVQRSCGRGREEMA